MNKINFSYASKSEHNFAQRLIIKTIESLTGKKKLEKLSEIKFLSEKNESLKNEIITSLTNEVDKKATRLKINTGYDKLIKEIQENSNIQIITKNKTDEDDDCDVNVLLPEYTYDLHSMVTHKGSLNQGHYVSYVRVKLDQEDDLTSNSNTTMDAIPQDIIKIAQQMKKVAITKEILRPASSASVSSQRTPRINEKAKNSR